MLNKRLNYIRKEIEEYEVIVTSVLCYKANLDIQPKYNVNSCKANLVAFTYICASLGITNEY